MINIGELLLNEKKGIKLWSSLHGVVEFLGYDPKDSTIDVRTSKGNEDWFDCYGRYFKHFPDGDCLLFPAKGQTWEDWKSLKEPKFEVGSWIVYNDPEICVYPRQITEIIDSKYILDNNHKVLSFDFATLETDCHIWSINDARDGDILATKTNGCPFIYNANRSVDGKAHYYAGVDCYNKFTRMKPDTLEYHFSSLDNVCPANKEQRDLLFNKMEEAGFEWDSNKKELCKLKPHYDISNFKPFDKVLCRGHDRQAWRPSFYGCYDTSGKHPLFICATANYMQCIPYENNEYLLGSTDMPHKRFINW